MTWGKRMLSCLLGLLLLFGTVSQYHLPLSAEDVTVDPMIDIGNDFVVALASNGTAWSWGQNDAGQLGIGSMSGENHPTPTKVNATVRFQSLSVGDSHVLALASDGSVWAWGANGLGQLGDEGTADQPTPVAVHGLSNRTVRQVAAGGNTSYALTSDGAVYAWGANTAGMLGDASLTAGDSRSIPTKVSALDGVFAERIFAGEGTVAVISGDGSVWMWGENSNLQCGVSTGQDLFTPTQKVAGTGELQYRARTVALGLYHTAILATDGMILNFGLNTSGQFGNTAVSAVPSYLLKGSKCTDVTAMQGVVDIAAGREHMLALTADGTLYAWGSNSAGQLATEEETNRHTPQAISLTALTNGTAVAIAAGYDNSALIDSEGHVFMWGSNSAGQLGNGTEGNDQYTPCPVLGNDGEGYLYLGVAEKEITHPVYVTATATIPSPSFSISIPATVDFGTLEQRTASDEDRYSSVAFAVGASNIKYLFGKRIVVQVSPAEGNAFALIGANGSTLPYAVYNLAEGGEPLAVDGVFATFQANGSVNGRLIIDKSRIEVADRYSGTLNFRVSVVEATGS